MDQLKAFLLNLPGFNWQVFLWGLPDELQDDTTQTVAVITPASDGRYTSGNDHTVSLQHRYGLQVYLTKRFRGDPSPLQARLIKALEVNGWQVASMRAPSIEPTTHQVTLGFTISKIKYL